MKNKILLAITASAICYTAGANAASFSIYEPEVEKGKTHIGASNTFSVTGDDNHREHEVEIGYGLTDRFAIELEGAVEKEDGEKAAYKASEVTGIYHLFNKNEKGLDIGLLLQYSLAHDGKDADEIAAGLLLEKELCNKTSLLSNIIIGSEVGSDAEDGLELKLSHSLNYELRDDLDIGIQLYNQFGKLNESLPLKEQHHYAGPAIEGEIGHFEYELGYLFGLTKGSEDGVILADFGVEF